MSLVCVSAARLMNSTARAICGWSPARGRSTSSQSWMEFNGFRSSWDTTPKNSSLAWLALSAAIRAACIRSMSSSRRSATRLRSVVSVMNPTWLTTVSRQLRTGLA